MTYTAGALKVAAKLAGRHLRDSRLPDSAIDVIDEAGAKDGQRPGPMSVARVPATVTATPGPDDCHRSDAVDDDRRRRTPRSTRRRRDRGRHRDVMVAPDGPHPREAGVGLRQGTPAHARRRFAPRGVRADECRRRRGHRDQAGAGRPRAAGSPSSRLLPVRPDRRGSGRPSWPSSWRSTLGNEFLRYDMSEYMEKACRWRD